MTLDIKSKTPEEMELIGSIFLDMFTKEQLRFHECPSEQLPSYVLFFSRVVLSLFKLEFLISDISVEDHYCLQINDDLSPFVVVGPSNYMFLTSEMMSSIEPRLVLKHFFKKYHGLDMMIEGNTAYFMKDGVPVKPPGSPLNSDE
jgi:hypothetical protein